MNTNTLLSQFKKFFQNTFPNNTIGAVSLIGVCLFLFIILFFPQQNTAIPIISNSAYAENIYPLSKANTEQKAVSFIPHISQLQLTSNSFNDTSFASALTILQNSNPEITFSNIALDATKKIEDAFLEACQEENLSLKNIVLSESDVRRSYSGLMYPYSAISIGILTHLSQKDRDDFIKNFSIKLKRSFAPSTPPALVPQFILDEKGNYFTITWNAIITHTIRFASETDTEVFMQKTLLGLAPPNPTDSTIPTLAIFIDDMGENKAHIHALLDLPFPVVFSIWPRSSYATYAAIFGNERGLPIYLHQPMQARPGFNMGSGGLTKSMSQEEIYHILRYNFLSVPYAYGLNNHTGSEFTKSAPDVENFLLAMKRLNPDIVLMDSLTSGESVLYKKALEHGFTSQLRTFFLDNTDDVNYILRQLDKALKHAQINGSAIAIGHSRDNTIRALKQWNTYKNTNVVIGLPNFY